jgi:hypothetical protein
MKAVLERVARRLPVAIEEIDISTDAELTERYGLEIPVLMFGKTKIAKYRATEEALVRRLR